MLILHQYCWRTRTIWNSQIHRIRKGIQRFNSNASNEADQSIRKSSKFVSFLKYVTFFGTGILIEWNFHLFQKVNQYNLSLNPSDWFPITHINKKTITHEVFEDLRQDPKIQSIVGHVPESYETYGDGIAYTMTGRDGATIYEVIFKIVPPNPSVVKKMIPDETKDNLETDYKITRILPSKFQRNLPLHFNVRVEVSNLAPKGSYRFIEVTNSKTGEIHHLLNHRAELLFQEKGIRYYWNKVYVAGHTVVLTLFLGSVNVVVYGGVIIAAGVIGVIERVYNLFVGTTGEKESSNGKTGAKEEKDEKEKK